jgi:hypothetical protein
MMATDLGDDRLIGILSEGDAVAVEVKYHLKCYSALCRRHTQWEEEQRTPVNEEGTFHARAMEQLLAYMEGEVSNGNDFFCLTELIDLYQSKLSALGGHGLPNRTRLKEKIIARCGFELREEQKGRYVYLIGNMSMGSMLEDMKQKRKAASAEYHVLAEAASICRRDASERTPSMFSGKFDDECQQAAVPTTIMFLLQMLIEGPSAIKQSVTQPTLSAAQVVLFNMSGISKSSPQIPLQTYIGLKTYTTTRSKGMIDIFHKLGLSLSYKTIMRLQNKVACGVVEQMLKEGVMCPRPLRMKRFTIAAGDNIDHNPSSTTSTDSFHGTALSMHQPGVASTTADSGARAALPLPSGENVAVIPDNYRTLPSLEGKTAASKPPLQRTATLHVPESVLQQELLKEEKWVQAAGEGLDQGSDQLCHWSAHHASTKSPEEPGIGALFPIFSEKSTNARMIKHLMHLTQRATEFLNPGQVAVIAFDQPLYALAKQIQWTYPSQFGEERFVVILGGLHTEKALWAAVGDLLQASGWAEKIAEAGVATSGLADACLKAAHITRTR